MLDQRRQNFHRIGPDDELVMIGADVFGDAARVMQLAEILFFKTDRKVLTGSARLLGHQRDHGARIDAAGKKRAERHFRHQANAHGLAQNFDRAFAGFFLADRQLFREIRLPVTFGLYLAIAPAAANVPGSSFRIAR